MAGNSSRRGAVRRAGTKKGAVTGTGGQKSKKLAGRGPTPKASDRTKAARRAGSPGARTNAAGSAAGSASGKAAGSPRSPASGGGRVPAGPRKFSAAAAEVVAGRNAVLEALLAGVPAKALYVVTRIDMDDRVRDAIKAAAGRGLPLLEIARPELERMVGGAQHQGLALQVPPYEYAHPHDLLDLAAASGRPPLIVVLDGVNDSRDLGAVVRSTAAFGGHGVVVPERRSAGVVAVTHKASAGAIARVPVARAPNLTRALTEYRDAGCFVVGLDGASDAALGDLELATEPLVLVAGVEGKGLSRLVRQMCDVVVSIPMVSGAESLSAGMATGVALYEVSRRRKER